MECRKHKHQSNKGVCPYCLRDKLSRLSNMKSYYIVNQSYRCSPSSDTGLSSPASPVATVKEHRRAGSMSMSFAVREAFSGNLALSGVLKKSRSMAHASGESVVIRDSNKKMEKKKNGFWTKLLHLKGKGGGGAVGGGVVTSRQRVF